MTRIDLDEQTADRLRAAAQTTTDPVELVSPDGVVLMRARPSPAAGWSEQEIEEILERRKTPGPTFTHAEVMLKLYEQQVRLEREGRDG